MLNEAQYDNRPLSDDERRIADEVLSRDQFPMAWISDSIRIAVLVRMGLRKPSGPQSV